MLPQLAFDLLIYNAENFVLEQGHNVQWKNWGAQDEKNFTGRAVVYHNSATAFPSNSAGFLLQNVAPGNHGKARIFGPCEAIMTAANFTDLIGAGPQTALGRTSFSSSVTDGSVLSCGDSGFDLCFTLVKAIPANVLLLPGNKYRIPVFANMLGKIGFQA